MSGYNGFKCGEVQVAKRDDSCLLRISSLTAWHNWQKAIQLADNVSRIDLQMTYEYSDGARNPIRKAHAAALRHSKRFKRGPSVTLITGSDGGDTLYLGKRQSDVMGRMYAKGIESKDSYWTNCVRYEVEYKGNLAKLVAKSLVVEPRPISRIHGSVGSFFAKRGVSLPVVSGTLVYRQPRCRTDLDERLRWLEKACKPSVALALRCGREVELLRALGVRVSAMGHLVISSETEIE